MPLIDILFSFFCSHAWVPKEERSLKKKIKGLKSEEEYEEDWMGIKRGLCNQNTTINLNTLTLYHDKYKYNYKFNIGLLPKVF